jgi:hypothetical protein
MNSILVLLYAYLEMRGGPRRYLRGNSVERCPAIAMFFHFTALPNLRLISVGSVGVVDIAN